MWKFQIQWDDIDRECLSLSVYECVNKRKGERQMRGERGYLSQVFSLSTLMKVWILPFKVEFIRVEDNVLCGHLQMASDETNYEC